MGRWILIGYAVVLSGLAVRAVDPIDRDIESSLNELKQKAEPAIGDAAFIRRATLDLVGRIPTIHERDAYIASKETDKKAKLIDRLMASPAYARHQGSMFEAMLSDRPGQRTGLHDYIVRAVRENRTWDRIFRDLLLPDESDPAKKGAIEYLKPRLNDFDKLATDVSVAFFGVNVSCAQCHDHPNVADWKQDHFFGMKSFLARSYETGGHIGEREVGLVKFKPTQGPERTAKLMFLTGRTVESDTVREMNKDEQKQEKERGEKSKGEKKAPPAPKFSARAALVETALQPKESAFFARNLVNRLWHRFFGVGLVTPLDQLHSTNDPSHPELLDALAVDFAKSGYDFNKLIRRLVLTETYARSSRSSGADVPPAKSYAIASIKALTPQQLGTSLKIAIADQKTLLFKSNDEFEKKIEQLEQAGRNVASSLAYPSEEDFQIGVSEALLFSNGDRIAKELLGDGSGTLLATMKADMDSSKIVASFFDHCYGRKPTAEEKEAFESYLSKRPGQRTEAIKHVLWALLTGPEFRFNH